MSRKRFLQCILITLMLLALYNSRPTYSYTLSDGEKVTITLVDDSSDVKLVAAVDIFSVEVESTTAAIGFFLTPDEYEDYCEIGAQYGSDYENDSGHVRYFYNKEYVHVFRLSGTKSGVCLKSSIGFNNLDRVLKMLQFKVK